MLLMILNRSDSRQLQNIKNKAAKTTGDVVLAASK